MELDEGCAPSYQVYKTSASLSMRIRRNGGPRGSFTLLQNTVCSGLRDMTDGPKMVGTTGFKPASEALGVPRTVQLCYVPITSLLIG